MWWRDREGILQIFSCAATLEMTGFVTQYVSDIKYSIKCEEIFSKSWSRLSVWIILQTNERGKL